MYIIYELSHVTTVVELLLQQQPWVNLNKTLPNLPFGAGAAALAGAADLAGAAALAAAAGAFSLDAGFTTGSSSSLSSAAKGFIFLVATNPSLLAPSKRLQPGCTPFLIKEPHNPPPQILTISSV